MGSSYKNRRRLGRYDLFVPLTLSTPHTVKNNAFKISSWVKNVSQDGIGLEIAISSTDETRPLREVAKKRQAVIASILLPDDVSIKARCRIVYGKPLAGKYLYYVGLKILAIEPLKRDKWNSFIKKCAQLDVWYMKKTV